LDGFGIPDSTYFLCFSPGPNWTNNSVDCDDTNPLLFPGSDADGDGFFGCVNDCDDSDPTINPLAIEICNGVDDDCDFHVDEDVNYTFYEDADGDGFGVGDKFITSCDSVVPPGYSAFNTDCDDLNALINPAQLEDCYNYIDDNCDGIINDGCNTELSDGFSPNGDNVGDEFLFRTNGGQEIEVVVFNRWGSIVFEANSTNDVRWNGVANRGVSTTEQLPVGTYFAIITVDGVMEKRSITIWK
jgi:gliding motility-associated-like protein